MLAQIRLPVTERSQIGAARRAAVTLCESHGLDTTQAGKLALCVTEAGTNIVKHAGSGQILLRVLERGATRGIEMLALDRGPGIVNVGASLRDGASSAGGQGIGLGAMARLGEGFEMYAPPGRGTAVRLELWPQPPPAPTETALGVVCLPKAGETEPGDAWTVVDVGARRWVLVADGLGHGPEAARAAHAATRVLESQPQDGPAAVIQRCHRALAPTRGAAVGVASLALNDERGSFAGVGNICCCLEAGQDRRQLISHHGTLGHTLRRVQEFEFAFPSGGLLIFHSDGLATHWHLGEYPGLAGRHPGTIAGVLYRDHDRGRDDVTVVVIRNVPPAKAT
ncbi:MAG TPA: ATP-binding protein [Steroidobacteraceae bacterium]